MNDSVVLKAEITRLNNDVTRLDHAVHVWKAKARQYEKVLERFETWPTKTMLQTPKELILMVRRVAKIALNGQQTRNDG